MTGSSPELPMAAAPAEAATPLRPLWARSLALVTSPRSVFEELERRPAWAWTAVVISLFALVVGYLIYEPVIFPFILEQAEKQNLSSQALAQAEQLYASPAFKFFTSFSGGAANFAFVVIAGLLLYAVCTFLLGGRAKVRQSLAVAAHAMLVHIPRSILVLPVMWARQDPYVSLGPGALFPPGEAEGFLAKALATFLGSLDLFNLWALALCILGMSVVSRLSAKQVGVAVVIGYLVLSALMALGGAALQPR
jgi:hypothetical protein